MWRVPCYVDNLPCRCHIGFCVGGRDRDACDGIASLALERYHKKARTRSRGSLPCIGVRTFCGLLAWETATSMITTGNESQFRHAHDAPPATPSATTGGGLHVRRNNRIFPSLIDVGAGKTFVCAGLAPRRFLIISREALQDELQFRLADIYTFHHPAVQHCSGDVAPTPFLLYLIDTIEHNALLSR